MKLLFISRKYPPSVGGMEKVSYDLSRELSKQVPTSIISWGKSQKWLPYFLPKAFFQALFLIPSKKITNIHLADGLLAPLGLILKILTRRKVTVTVHGLDITYKNKFYQAVVPFCLSRLDKIICISSATKAECIKHGIPANLCTVIPWGVYPDEFKINASRKDLEKIAGMNLKNKKVLITVGRLMKRKGINWFIKSVMPRLDQKYVYLVAGDGPEKPAIIKTIESLKMQNRVKLLGKISDHDKKVLYNTADVFVMPNIKVEGDMEGFGIVAIEAASAGLSVIASSVEGIQQSVVKGTGSLITPGKASLFIKALETSQPSKVTVVKTVEKVFSWQTISAQYMNETNI